MVVLSPVRLYCWVTIANDVYTFQTSASVTFVIRKKYYICFKGVGQPVSATSAHTKVVSRARRGWGDLGIRGWLAQLTVILPNPESRHSDLFQLPGKQPMCSGDS